MTRYDSDALAIPFHEDTKSSVHALSHAIVWQVDDAPPAIRWEGVALPQSLRAFKTAITPNQTCLGHSSIW